MRLKQFLKEGGNVNDIDNQWNKMSISDRTDYIKNNLLKRGYTQNQTAAILGNLLQENGNLNTNTTNTSSGALGIAQWLGPRKTSIISQGKHNSISGQLDFLDQEIKGKGAWTNNIGGQNAFFNSDNIEQLTHIFRKDFERPGEKEANDKSRIKNAYNVLGQQYNSQKNTPSYMTMDTKVFDDMKSGLWDYKAINEAYSKNPGFTEMMVSNIQSQKDMEEKQKLDQERLQQEENKKIIEQENQQIELALQQKEEDKKRLLSMIPQSGVVASGNIKPMMRTGGSIDIKNFFKNQI